jgi:hypothetical protein
MLLDISRITHDAIIFHGDISFKHLSTLLQSSSPKFLFIQSNYLCDPKTENFNKLKKYKENHGTRSSACVGQNPTHNVRASLRSSTTIRIKFAKKQNNKIDNTSKI